MLNGSTRFAPGQTLLIDADDTLWENNIYFERAIAAFISYLDHHEYTHDEVRQVLNEVERENTRLHGYGVASFRRALVTCFERLSAESVTDDRHERIVSFANCITEQEIELLPGVQDTLPVLAERHRLILMTKGNPEEQSHKLARSGLSDFFTAVEIPHEKNPEAYCSVCSRYSLSCETTWMIGNSPRSDINPALAAGLHAVYIHHPNTWVLEHETIDPTPTGQLFLELDGFAKLSHHF